MTELQTTGRPGPAGVAVDQIAITNDDLRISPAARRVLAAQQALGSLLASISQPSILAARLETKFEDRVQRRRYYEQIWLEMYQRYNNQYPEHIRARIHPRKSHLFVGMTALKVNSAHSSIMDFLRGSGEDKLPWSIDPAKIPENTILPEGMDINALREVVQETTDAMGIVVENQMDASDFEEELDLAVLEMCITGTMAMRGPMTVPETGKFWEMDPFNGNQMREVDSDLKYKPVCKYLSVFNAYPDMEAPNVQAGNGFFEEMRLTRSQLLDLALLDNINMAAVLEVLKQRPNANITSYQATLRSILGDTMPNETTRYSVKIYFGEITGEELRGTGMVQLPEDAMHVPIMAEIWYCGNHIFKARVHKGPVPYYIVPYVRRGNIPYGKGVAELGQSSQDAINGSARAIMDNAAIAVGPIVEKNLQLLEVNPGKDVHDIAAWEVILADHDGMNGKRAVSFTEIPAYTQQFMLIFDKFRQVMDEETFLPSIGSGMQGTGTTKTFSGMSLLNSNANKTLKKVMRNVDDRLIEPIIEGMIDWNLRFNPMEEIRGPMQVVAKGSQSLMATELRTQRLLTLLQIIQGNPNYKEDEVVRMLAVELGVPPSKVVLTKEEKQMMNEMQAQAIAEGTGQNGGQPNTPNPAPAQGGGGTPPNIDSEMPGGPPTGAVNQAQPGDIPLA